MSRREWSGSAATAPVGQPHVRAVRLRRPILEWKEWVARLAEADRTSMNGAGRPGAREVRPGDRVPVGPARAIGARVQAEIRATEPLSRVNAVEDRAGHV
jgi:hypothetical protein